MSWIYVNRNVRYLNYKSSLQFLLLLRKNQQRHYHMIKYLIFNKLVTMNKFFAFWIYIRIINIWNDDVGFNKCAARIIYPGDRINLLKKESSKINSHLFLLNETKRYQNSFTFCRKKNQRIIGKVGETRFFILRVNRLIFKKGRWSM